MTAKRKRISAGRWLLWKRRPGRGGEAAKPRTTGLAESSRRKASVLRSRSTDNGKAPLLDVDGAERPTAAAAKPSPATMRDAALARLEALLFIAGAPLSSRKLAELANLADGTQARTLVRRLNELYQTDGSACFVDEVAGGFQLFTRPVFARWLRRLSAPGLLRLSQPALETLTIIAYRQPVLRAELESVRGVQCGEMLRQLLERDLVRIVGRSRELGRPFLYGTTRKFLQLFGLRSLDDLPKPAILHPPSNAPGVGLGAPGNTVQSTVGSPEVSHEEFPVKTVMFAESALDEHQGRTGLFDPVTQGLSADVLHGGSPPIRAAKEDDDDLEADIDEEDDEEDEDDDDLEESEWEEVEDDDLDEDLDEDEDEDEDWDDDEDDLDDDEDDEDWEEEKESD